MPENYDEKLRTEYDSWEADYEDTADEHSTAWLDDDYDEVARLEDKLGSDYMSRSSYLSRIKEDMRMLFPNGKYRSVSEIDYTVFNDNPEVMKKLKTATGLLRDAAMTCSQLSDNDRKKKAAAVEALSAYIGYHCSLKLSWDGIEDANEKFYDVWPVVFEEAVKHLKDFIGDDKGQKSFRQYIYFLTKYRYINIKDKLKEPLKKDKLKEHQKNAPEFVDNGNDLIMKLADDVSRFETKIRCIQEIKEALEICLSGRDPKYKITQDEYDIIAYNMGFFEGLPEPLSLKEIASKIDKSYDYVNKHFHYAADKLRKVILKKFYN